MSSLDQFQEAKNLDTSQYNKSIEALNESKNIRRIQGEYNPKFNNITKNFNKVTDLLIEVSNDWTKVLNELSCFNTEFSNLEKKLEIANTTSQEFSKNNNPDDLQLIAFFESQKNSFEQASLINTKIDSCAAIKPQADRIDPYKLLAGEFKNISDAIVAKDTTKIEKATVNIKNFQANKDPMVNADSLKAVKDRVQEFELKAKQIEEAINKATKENQEELSKLGFTTK